MHFKVSQSTHTHKLMELLNSLYKVSIPILKAKKDYTTAHIAISLMNTDGKILNRLFLKVRFILHLGHFLYVLSEGNV